MASPKIMSSVKAPSHFFSSMKLKTLTLSHIYLAISKLKSVIIQLLKNMLPKTNKNKQIFGSFRLYYNWCSSSRTLAPVILQSCSGWSSDASSSIRYDGMQDSGELMQYLQWLEEKEDGDWSNEIDRLADLFIADCHEKFRLEKEESYRRFQEMMARSV